MHLSTLFVGCALYLCFQFGDAKLVDVTSVVSSVVEQSYRHHANAKLVKRHKREVATKILEDPQSCIYQCYLNESKAIVSVTMKNILRLVGLSLQDVKGDELDTPEKEAELKKRVEAKTIANMGPLFDDLCKVTKIADDCYSTCPKSQLRNVLTLYHQDAQAFCEPGKNWGNFSDYWDAINCTNSTESEKPCERKCGQNVTIANVTNLEIGEPEIDGTEIHYETSVKQNNAAVGPACKTSLCEISCYKPIITEKCGAKAYDLYVRMNKEEPHVSLGILKELNAVEDNKECKEFQ